MFNFCRKQKNFFAYWADLKPAWRNSKIMLFLDFDGTLAPIVEQPQKASLSPDMKTTLATLSQRNSAFLAIVTGRSLADIRQKVGINAITYIANHGFEIEGLNIHVRKPLDPHTIQAYRKIEIELRDILKGIPGIIFEDKGLVLSIHYRMVNDTEKNFVKQSINRIAKPHIRSREVSLRKGKEVSEIRPPINWDKGKAILFLLHSMKKSPSQKSVMIYIGDDDTDEDAFKALRTQAVTIRVGQSASSAAKYYLNNITQVYDFLCQVAEITR